MDQLKLGIVANFSWSISGSAGSEVYMSSNALSFSFYRVVYVAGGGFLGLTVKSLQLTGYPLTNLQMSADITSS
eukprot:54057-Eustigmatos_ZCMA.PRE.1